jgi:hypothetical protein
MKRSLNSACKIPPEKFYPDDPRVLDDSLRRKTVRPRSATGTIIATTLLLSCSRADAQSRPEYDAEIADDRVYVLSGPGTNYYPTNILNRDDRVTVYGRPIGDYVQILPPPERSFSWIRGTEVEENENGDCLVKTDDAGVYVGSEIHREARFVRQVRLRRGAKVKVLDKVMVQGVGPGSGQLHEWYKILPPEDEVRYVLAAKIRQPYPVSLVPQTPGNSKDGENGKPPRKASSDMTAETQPVARRMFRPDEPIPPAVPVSGSKSLESKPTTIDSEKPKTRRPAGANAVEIEKFSADLDHLQERLPQEWNLPLLEKRLATLENSVDGPQEKADVETLKKRIVGMRSVERRLKEIEDRGRQYKQTDAEFAAEIDRILGVNTRSSRRFTAQGVLEASKTLVDGKKVFQLVDSQKRPTHLLIASPGINLDKHLRRRVGVIGRAESRTGVALPVLRVTQLSILEE